MINTDISNQKTIALLLLMMALTPISYAEKTTIKPQTTNIVDDAVNSFVAKKVMNAKHQVVSRIKYSKSVDLDDDGIQEIVIVWNLLGDSSFGDSLTVLKLIPNNGYMEKGTLDLDGNDSKVVSIMEGVITIQQTLNNEVAITKYRIETKEPYIVGVWGAMEQKRHLSLLGAFKQTSLSPIEFFKGWMPVGFFGLGLMG